jgi:galactoside O-acetyltransferase
MKSDNKLMLILKYIYRKFNFINIYTHYFQIIRIINYKILSTKTKTIGKPTLLQPLLKSGNGTIIFKENVTIGYFPSPMFFSTYAHFDLRGENSSIEIGNEVYINNNATFIADGAKITIGDKTLIGVNLSIYTSDFHTLDPLKRNNKNFPKIDVTIGKNVFIGSNVTILKGIIIGDNSVIGAGSIVNTNIPPNVLATGIPCQIIRKFE